MRNMVTVDYVVCSVVYSVLCAVSDTWLVDCAGAEDTCL